MSLDVASLKIDFLFACFDCWSVSIHVVVCFGSVSVNLDSVSLCLGVCRCV